MSAKSKKRRTILDLQAMKAKGEKIAARNAAFLRKLEQFDVTLIAGQAKSHCVAWTIADFAVAGVLIFGAGLAFIMITRHSKTMAQRCVVGISVAVIFFCIWAELAVGVFTNLGS